MPKQKRIPKFQVNQSKYFPYPNDVVRDLADIRGIEIEGEWSKRYRVKIIEELEAWDADPARKTAEDIAFQKWKEFYQVTTSNWPTSRIQLELQEGGLPWHNGIPRPELIRSLYTLHQDCGFHLPLRSIAYNSDITRMLSRTFTADPKRTGFLDLPRELRDAIYKDAFFNDPAGLSLATVFDEWRVYYDVQMDRNGEMDSLRIYIDRRTSRRAASRRTKFTLDLMSAMSRQVRQEVRVALQESLQFEENRRNRIARR
ncbi:hypothetical protein BU26DRAFT_597384 [Trematosphaeria pertusa]|uniref:Uncharacterized protein n=1 Tax=Trematosphaeria pertusa TaxID=390896 RepID=A0A6A6IB69_9PLEO|nr:uncharacterized protein BU26DRAFT_597384 [Trematosphaeria pertusa]KAF2247457.1 hypothetical protein BU26DRAFT_597384 [Trematosphaeria pertusa]